MQTRHRGVVAVAVLLAASLLAGCQWWGQVGFSAARTRFHPTEKAIGVENVNRLQERWSVPLGGVVGDPVVFGSGPKGTRVYVNTNGVDANGNWFAVFHVLGARTGVRRWSAAQAPNYQGAFVHQSAGAVVGGIAYAGGGGNVAGAVAGQIDAFDAISGDRVWTSTVPVFSGRISGPPAVTGGKVYASYFYADPGLRIGGLAAWDTATGEQGWISEVAFGGYLGQGSVAVNQRFVYQAAQRADGGEGRLSAFDAKGNVNCGDFAGPPETKECRAVWSGSIGTVTTVESSPAVSGGVVYVGSDDNKLYAFDADGCDAPTCSPLWTATTGGDIESSPAVANGVVYIGSEDNKLHAFDADGCGAPTCSPLWTAATGGNVDSSPAVANGVVYVGSDDDKLYAFAARGCGAATCRPLWTATTGGDIDSSPALGNRMVYVGSADGQLYAFGLPT